ncbi:Protein of unknown function [Izhakiella capsodis]|uniref:DUF2815 family protein n=1 Tax=Izhakiella capsodis TaxID=1367852 RepID=A0A1I4X300_9GAMM|nr:DUF2815 family protein [Izhakiella capsodis]SFN20391.1 Protein of unknown function [Izhakiella capsodis]
MKVKLNNVRLAFPALFEPKTVNGEDAPRFSATFIFPVDHPCLKDIDAAIAQVAKDKWGPKADSVLKSLRSGLKVCLHDGDEKVEYEDYSGNKFLSASNKVRPLVIDRNRSVLTTADGKPYAGCYVNATIDIWAMDNNFGKRINASLGGVQFCRDGDAFAGGGMTTENDFDDMSAGVDAELLI